MIDSLNPSSTSQKANLFRSIGEKLFGERWQSELSPALSVNERSLRRWLAGQDEIPPGVWSDLALIVDSHLVNIRELGYQIQDLNRIAVYNFEIFDTRQGGYLRNTSSKRTAEDIERYGGRIIPGTQQFVDRRALDDQGRYFPPADGAQWSVGDVASTTEGYGFNVLDKFRAPIAAFGYPDKELAERSHDLVAAALGDAVLVRGHSH